MHHQVIVGDKISKDTCFCNFFFLTRSLNRRVLRACTSDTLGFRIPYCSVAIPSNSSSCFVVYQHRDLLCIFAFMLKKVWGVSCGGINHRDIFELLGPVSSYLSWGG